MDRNNGPGGANRPILMRRANYMIWNDYFMATAFLAAKRSKNPRTQAGACIVTRDTSIIVGVGYNGLPRGCNDDDIVWRETMKLYMVHAEENAILNSNIADLKDCKMFASRFPCNKCAQLIIQSGIREVVFMSDEDAGSEKNKAARIMFDSANVTYTQFAPTNREIKIDFTQVSLLP